MDKGQEPEDTVWLSLRDNPSHAAEEEREERHARQRTAPFVINHAQWHWADSGAFRATDREFFIVLLFVFLLLLKVSQLGVRVL